MAVRRSVAAQPDLRRHLADKLRTLIEMYEGVPEATVHWGRELERIEAGEQIFVYGWQVRGVGVPVHLHGHYYLTADDEVVPAVRVGDEIVPADSAGLDGGDRPRVSAGTSTEGRRR